MTILQIAVIVILVGWTVPPLWAQDTAGKSSEVTSSTILTLQNVLVSVEDGHPLLQGSQTQKTVATGKLLKALGAFEPNLVNDWELERLVKSGETSSLGFNDTFVELRHPWGVRGIVGFRAGIGDVEVADLGINDSNQPLLGIVFPLLRGFHDQPCSCRIKEIGTRQQTSRTRNSTNTARSLPWGCHAVLELGRCLEISLIYRTKPSQLQRLVPLN